jgi:hypothetical protein
MEMICTATEGALVAMPDVETLEAMADWKESLHERIRLAQLRFELLDADSDFTGLQDETEDFKRAVRIITWRPGR